MVSNFFLQKVSNMDFIFIFGPQAVGKMTVGQELSQKTGFPLFYNHLSIDLARALYPSKDTNFIKHLTLVNFLTFNYFISNPSSKGLIYTDVWLLNRKYDVEIKHKMFELFNSRNWNIYLVELVAPFEIRMERNRSEDRIKTKPSKRDFVLSNEALLYEEKYQITNTCNFKDFLLPSYVKKHIVINNENLQALETCSLIMEEIHKCLKNR